MYEVGEYKNVEICAYVRKPDMSCPHSFPVHLMLVATDITAGLLSFNFTIMIMLLCSPGRGLHDR